MLVSLMIFIEFWKFDRVEHLGVKFAVLFGRLQPLSASVAAAGQEAEAAKPGPSVCTVCISFVPLCCLPAASGEGLGFWAVYPGPSVICSLPTFLAPPLATCQPRRAPCPARLDHLDRAPPLCVLRLHMLPLYWNAILHLADSCSCLWGTWVPTPV